MKHLIRMLECATRQRMAHRFVARAEVYLEMLARGSIGEGVTMCLDDRGL